MCTMRTNLLLAIFDAEGEDEEETGEGGGKQRSNKQGPLPPRRTTSVCTSALSQLVAPAEHL